jgi:hypothetical protein
VGTVLQPNSNSGMRRSAIAAMEVLASCMKQPVSRPALPRPTPPHPSADSGAGLQQCPSASLPPKFPLKPPRLFPPPPPPQVSSYLSSILAKLNPSLHQRRIAPIKGVAYATHQARAA